MRSGKRDRQVQLLLQSETKDSFGTALVEYYNVATVWAEVKDLRGREFFAARQINSEITTKFKINYRSGVDTSWLIKWKGKVYSVFQVVEVGRNEGLEVLAAASNNNTVPIVEAAEGVINNLIDGGDSGS